MNLTLWNPWAKQWGDSNVKHRKRNCHCCRSRDSTKFSVWIDKRRGAMMYGESEGLLTKKNESQIEHRCGIGGEAQGKGK